MTVAILGSCVTRDAFAHHQDVLGKPERYFARSGLASAMSERVFDGVDVSTIESAFQRAIVEADLDGSFVRYVHESEFDLLIYDPIDERFALFLDGTGALATRSSEFLRATVDVSGCVRIEPHSEEFFSRWEEAWSDFVLTLRDGGALGRVRVNQVYWATHIDGPGEFPAIYSARLIAQANVFLDRLYDRMRRDLPESQFFVYPDEELAAASEHRWGLAPFHYNAPYYRRLCDYILAASERSTPPVSDPERAPATSTTHEESAVVKGPDAGRWWRRSRGV